jgi:hypothetical protein
MDFLGLNYNSLLEGLKHARLIIFLPMHLMAKMVFLHAYLLLVAHLPLQYQDAYYPGPIQTLLIHSSITTKY